MLSSLSRRLPVLRFARYHARGVAVSSGRRAVEIENEEDFRKKVIEAQIPVLVDFYATWCGPCRSLSPLLEDVTSKRKGVIELAKVDIDNLPDLALEYQVSAVPAVMGVKGGKVVAEFVGLRDAQFLEQFVRDLVQDTD